MGLDMYLVADKYVGGWNHSSEKEKAVFKKVVSAVNAKTVAAGSPHVHVRVCVAYWRKANAIHKWFIDQCAEGKDDCRPVYVSREQLTELRDLCQKVLDTAKLVDGLVTNGYTIHNGKEVPIKEPGKLVSNPKELSELLPTQSGFFFGSTDYNEYYIADVKDTVKMLDEVLKNYGEEKGWSLYYEASW